MIFRRVSLMIAALGALAPWACFVRSPQAAQPGTSNPAAAINLQADKLSSSDSGNQIEATGNVEIKREGSTLKADELRMNRATQDVEAKGRVMLDDPEWKIKSADSIRMNMENETGELHNADLFLEQGHISMSGRRFEKFGGQTYHVDDGFFTTCLCESGAPSWKFFAEQMDLTLDGTGTVKNGIFYILDVPVLYIPYGFFPLRSERQSGFLFPSVGSSSDDGFRYLQPFFWAISKSTDATLSFDLETRTRFGFIGEYRTLFDRNSDFTLESSYFNENWRQHRSVADPTIADPNIPKDRWNIFGSHRYTTGSDWLTYSDTAAYSDDLFTRELMGRLDLSVGQEGNIRRSRYGESRMGLFKNWGDTFLKGEFNFYQDFIQPDSTTFLRTPQIGFWGRRLFSGFPLELRWSADGVNYMRRERGDGIRFDFRPEAVLPFRLASVVNGSVSVAPRETIYHLYSTPVNSSDHNVSRELVEIRGNLNTAVSRIFAVDSLGLKQVKHVIEPELSYLFIPRVNQNDIPLMDNVDRVNRRNVLTFALNNRLWGKSAGPLTDQILDSGTEYLSPVVTGDVREMASLRMALSYDIDKERKGGDSLTDLDFRLRLTPAPFLDFALDGGLNPGPWEFTQALAAVSVTDPRPLFRRSLDADFNRPNSFGLSYHFLRRGPNSFLADNANADVDLCIATPNQASCKKDTVGNLNNNLLYHLTDNLLFNFSSTYDVRDSRFIGFRAISKFMSFCECWTVTFGVTHTVNPDKTSFSVNFSLLGLGNPKSSLR
ncbi:MAG TPA: LPS assembly protein LptD [Candidatus Binatia bacterium]|nr:LPS assembly protein LptD [Candidatus Binatia bacterium]